MATRGVGRPKVIYPVKRGVSQPLRNFVAKPAVAGPPVERARPQAPVQPGASSAVAQPDSMVQGPVANAAPAPTLSFDGLNNGDNGALLGFRVFPPDTNGDVGPNHFVEYINLIIGVYDKSGNRLALLPGNAPWAGFGGECESHNDGDPIVLYDHLADRWVFSQFAIAASGHQCFAVSQTPDPLGPYFQYDFVVSPAGAFNDYPKIGVWTDAYYMSFNEFNPNFNAAVAVAVDRNAMILGLPAAMVRFDVTSTAEDTFFSLQPSHLEGRTLPPAGAPNFYIQAFDDETWSATPDPLTDHYNLWAFHVDFQDPGASILVGPTEISTGEFDANLCDFGPCAPQPPGGEIKDTLSQFTMYRLAYRNFGDHESLVINHTTDVGGDRGGIRWGEIRNPNTTPVLNDSGTFAPDDGLFRWMGSASIDGSGNIAIGYTVSSATDTFPGARYAARLADDPPGELGQGEAVIVDGSSVANGFNRWGDYAALSVDETDDCTFWYVGEYATSAFPGDWSTRIASFQLPLCTATEIGTIAGTVTMRNGQPLAGAKVSAGGFSATSASDGTYTLRVAAGTYDVSASAFGFIAQTVAGVAVADGQTATINFRLTSAPRVRVSGFVSDDGQARWPLYAHLTFTPAGAPAVHVFTNPLTGFYAVRLPSGTDFNLSVQALVPGYVAETRPITPGPGDTVQNFALEVNNGTCNALGYTLNQVALGSEAFEGTFPPDGWTVDNATTDCAAPGIGAWSNVDVGGRTNLTGGTGVFGIADSDRCGPAVGMNTTLTSPPIDLSGLTDAEGLQISFNQDLFTLPATTATVQVWDGAEWQTISTQTTDSHATRITVGTKLANGVADARVRFVYTAAWDWWWEIDDITFSSTSCDYVGGGLVFGNITDRNTLAAVNGAKVQPSGGQPAVTSVATPLDPSQADGLYFAFLAGQGTLTASATGYQPRTVSVIPQINGAIRRNIALSAGRVSFSPAELALRVPYRGTASTSLTVSNTGTAPATVDISEIEGPASTVTVGPFEPSGRRTGAHDIHITDARSVRPHETKLTRPLAAGDVVNIIQTGLPGPWGLGFDVPSTSGWVSNIGLLQGDDRLHQFLPNGTSTGETAPSSTPAWGADLAYDSRSNTLWQVNVGGDNCIHELDLGSRAFTGRTICPNFGTSERGLAYDPVTDTFYAGTWNDGRIVQFDREGTILRAVNVGLNISGLAYNSSTGHLFVAINDAASLPFIFVFDTAGDLTQIGQFDITQGGTDIFGDFAGAGIELDCTGKLWAVNQSTKVIAVAESNEPPGCKADVAWIDTQPQSVTIPAGTSVTINIAVDASTLTPGLHEAQFLFLTDTPYQVPALPFHVTVAFNDVPEGSFGDAEIHGLAGAGISFGCAPGQFCPADPLTRVVYPTWGLKSAFGSEYDSPNPTGLMFDDLGTKTFGADAAEDAVDRGLMDGCGVRLFCPDAATTKREAAVFTLRMLFGADYVPPAATGVFTDVDAADAPFVEDAVNRGFMSGCGATTFCPAEGLDRASSAIIFVRAFGFRTFP